MYVYMYECMYANRAETEKWTILQHEILERDN